MCLGIFCGVLGAGWIGFVRHLNLIRNRTPWLTTPRSRAIQVLVTTAVTVAIAYPSAFLSLSQKEHINHLFNDLHGRSFWNFDTTATWINLVMFLCYVVRWSDR